MTQRVDSILFFCYNELGDTMERKITIGLFNDAFYPAVDGVVSVVDNYARKLSKKANVIVFVPDYKKPYDDSKYPYKVVRVKSVKIPTVEYTFATPKVDMKFYHQIHKYYLDIIHVHSPFSLGATAIKYANKHRIPVVTTMHSQHKRDLKNITHSNVLSYFGTKKLISIYEHSNECWAVNGGVAKLFFKEYGYHKLPRVMPNATEMTLVKNTAHAHDVINKKHNINPNDKVFLFVGRLYRLKNIFFIVDALSELEKLKPNFNYKMLFIGTGQDEEKLAKYIKDKKLSDKVIICGKVMDRELLAYYYNRADLFLFPSMYDANSIVQIEASSQKTPTIFVKGAITASDIINNETGFIANEKPKDYAKKIIEVLNNKELYNHVSENAYKKIYRTWDEITDEVYNSYLRLIDEFNKKKTKRNSNKENKYEKFE